MKFVRLGLRFEFSIRIVRVSVWFVIITKLKCAHIDVLQCLLCIYLCSCVCVNARTHGTNTIQIERESRREKISQDSCENESAKTTTTTKRPNDNNNVSNSNNDGTDNDDDDSKSRQKQEEIKAFRAIATQHSQMMREIDYIKQFVELESEVYCDGRTTEAAFRFSFVH